MTFEQPASLSRFVAEPTPVTWAGRWKYIRIFLPILVFITVCFAERMGFMLWAADAFKLSFFWVVFLPAGCLLVAILILGEIRLRGSSGNSARRLNVMENGVNFCTGQRPFIRWPKVVAFWFEDIPGEPQLSKVTMEYFGRRQTKLPRRDAWVLDKRNQYPALLAELKRLQQQHKLNFHIELDRPLPPRRLPRYPMWGMSLTLAGLYFLLHGAPLLLLSATHRESEPPSSESAMPWSPKQKEQVVRFIKTHFSDRAEFRRGMIEIGGVLTVLGIGFIVWGMVVQRQLIEEKLPVPAAKD
jgi:hypothetical protein